MLDRNECYTIKKNTLPSTTNMKARYVITGSVVLVLSIVIFIGIQEAKVFAAEGMAASEAEQESTASITQTSPTRAAVYGMSQEIAIWSELVELATFAGAGIAVIMLGYGLLSRDWPERMVSSPS
jgi:hypothetical protein